MEGEVSFFLGSEGETVKVSAERPTGQVLNLGVQRGPDGGNVLRSGGMEQGLLQLRKLLKIIESGRNVLKDSEEKEEFIHLLHLFSLSVTLNFLHLRSVLVHIHIKLGFFSSFKVF